MKKTIRKRRIKQFLILCFFMLILISIIINFTNAKNNKPQEKPKEFITISNTKNWQNEKKKIIINNKKITKVYCQTTNINIAYCKDNYIYMKSPGKVTLKFYTKNNKKTIKKTIEVYKSPKINFNKNNIIIENKSKEKLKLITQDYPLNNIKFTSNHPETVSVNNKGEITAHNPSIATITAETLDGMKTEINIRVKETKGLITRKTLDEKGAYKYDKLMIVAHPDDETLWGGANLYNDSYFVVCLTNGNNEVRSKEYKNILKFTKNGGIILNYPDDPDGIRDEWEYTKIGINKDITRLITYKNWQSIVTYNPDGVTGHIHHKKTFQHVYKVCNKYNLLDRLYYFGHFYKKWELPNNLIRMSDKDLKIKYEEIQLYSSVRNNIHNFWEQMLPYENWIPATKWNEYPR